MDNYGSPEWQRKHYDAQKDGALGNQFSPHRYSGPHQQTFNNSALMAGRDINTLSPQNIGTRASATAGDAVGIIVFLGGTVLSFLATLESQSPGPFGSGLLLSTVSAIAIKLAIDSSGEITPLIEAPQKVREDSITDKKLGILSTVSHIINRLEKHLNQGTLEDYLKNDGASKLKSFEDLIYKDPNLTYPTKTLDKSEEEILRLIELIKYHVNAGTLKRSLQKDNTDTEKLRSRWHGLLLGVPNQTKAQIHLKTEKQNIKIRKRKVALNNIASFVINSSLALGIATSAFSHATTPIIKQPPPVVTETLPTHYVATQSEHLNIRTSPSVNGTIIGDFDKGACITIMREVQNGWQRVELPNNRQGFVFGEFTRPIPNGYNCP